MLDDTLRQVKEVALKPIAVQLRTVNPNVVSVCGLVVGVASAGLVFAGYIGAGLVLWLLNRLLDGLDGTIARVHDKQTDFGGYFDILLDYVVYALIPVAFAVQHGTSAALVAGLVLLTTFYINASSWMMLSAILEKRAQSAHNKLTTVAMPRGLIEGTETVLFYIAFYVFPQSIVFLFALMSAGVVITVMGRLWWAWHHLSG